MVRTHGLTHINLVVRDVQRSLRVLTVTAMFQQQTTMSCSGPLISDIVFFRVVCTRLLGDGDLEVFPLR
jgi:hypothetical protein